VLRSAPTSLARSDGDYLGILIEDTGIGGFVVDATRERRFHGQGGKGRPCADKKGGEHGLDSLNFRVSTRVLDSRQGLANREE
jgi:hypothetical protein